MTEPYIVPNSLQTQAQLDKYLKGEYKFGLFENIYTKFQSLESNLDYTINFENEPQALNFTIYSFSNEPYEFLVFINIDKLYQLFEDSKCVPTNLPINSLDLGLALRSKFKPIFPERPILILSNDILSSIFTTDEYKGKFYPIDGRNRIRTNIENNKDNINCYIVDLKTLLKCMMSNYDSLAIELVVAYYKIFG